MDDGEVCCDAALVGGEVSAACVIVEWRRADKAGVLTAEALSRLCEAATGAAPVATRVRPQLRSAWLRLAGAEEARAVVAQLPGLCRKELRKSVTATLAVLLPRHVADRVAAPDGHRLSWAVAEEAGARVVQVRVADDVVDAAVDAALRLFPRPAECLRHEAADVAGAPDAKQLGGAGESLVRHLAAATGVDVDGAAVLPWWPARDPWTAPRVQPWSRCGPALAVAAVRAPLTVLLRRAGGDFASCALRPGSALVLEGASRAEWSWSAAAPARAEEGDGRVGLLVVATTAPGADGAAPAAAGGDELVRIAAVATRPAAGDSAAVPDDLARVQDGRDMEAALVQTFYETVAEHFSATRHSPWPRVAKFVRSLPPASVVADVGCGNGKYMKLRGDLAAVGFDASSSLARICEGRALNVCVADVLDVPMRSGCCDAVLCIAVLHHLSTEQRRAAAVAELARLLRPGGVALITVWALEQGRGSRRRFAEQDVLVPWDMPRKYLGDGSGDAREDGDERVTVRRYCHVYHRGELEELVGRVGGVRVVASFYDASNWCVVMRKRGRGDVVYSV